LFKLLSSVCASQILWKFVLNCWSTHAATTAAKPSGRCVCDDDSLWSADRKGKRAATACT